MDVEQIIKEVLAEELGVPKHLIQSHAYFSHDLGVKGGDADDLIGAVRKRLNKEFEIDMDEYFHPEAIIHFRKVTDITIADLAKMISKQVE
ncbi:MAG: hypothetical protein OEU92_18670 [Alphaproteobacteria bacterium]|nr:hypothetical protein [Alphaproteobacteria bacterium]